MTLQDRIKRAQYNVDAAERIISDSTDEAMGCEAVGFEERHNRCIERIGRWQTELEIWRATLISLQNLH